MHSPRLSRCVVLLVVLCAAGGCGVFRGIPTHGGGKRFDEEQRVVAGAVRQAVSQIDFTGLEGKRVQIVIESIAHEGGGSFTAPGLQSIGLNASINDYAGNIIRVAPSEGSVGIDDTRTQTSGIGGNLNWHFNPLFSTHNVSTHSDLSYLRAALEMQARHAGVIIGRGEPEVILYVLIDIIGTNRSRSDRFAMNVDMLTATCETTYYAIDATTHELILRARRTAAAAQYRETRGLGIGGVHIVRSISRTEPTPFTPHVMESLVEVVTSGKSPDTAKVTSINTSEYLLE